MNKPLIVNKDNIEIPVGTVEDFKRPNHPDFMDSSELKKIKFGGLRDNTLTGDKELWIEGEVVKAITANELRLNPHAVTDAMEEFFQTGRDVRPDIPELRKLRGE